MIGKVNVRSMPSVYGGWVTRIRRAGTEVEVTDEVLNSRGETWYAIRMYQGYVGYIRGDLLRVDIRPAEAPQKQESARIIEAVGSKPTVIYIVLDPSYFEAGETPQIIYITPEQAAAMGGS